MEQIRTDALLNFHSFGGCLIVVNGTETQNTRFALALQDILRNGTHARSRDLGSKWEGSSFSTFKF